MRARSVVALSLAAVVVVLMFLVPFAVTSEYGATPNGGGAAEVLTTLAGGLPGAALVAFLVWAGVRGAPRRRRLLLGAAGALVALGALALGLALGHLVLEQRCEDRGAQHSAACPGFAGPG